MANARNPWEDIELADYEAHMALGSVAQLQALNALMRGQFAACPPGDVAVFGVAGGNGLEHADPQRAPRVYGVDINEDYLVRAAERFGGAAFEFVPVRADLLDPQVELPRATSVIANLLVEYVGVGPFAAAVRRSGASFASCAIQIDQPNPQGAWVSDSPYLHAFDGLDVVHVAVDEASLTAAMRAAGLASCLREEVDLPNGKRFARLDFAVKAGEWG